MWRRLLALISRVRSTYWFVPSLVTTGAVGLALLLIALDRSYPSRSDWLGWAYGGGADGARSLLSSVSTSTITVVSVTFSVMVVALTVSSQHFGPRLLNSFMCDTGSQFVLGAFTGTFAYCLIVLRTVQGDSGAADAFVPHLAVTGAVALTLTSVGMLIYYVHHVAVSMQVSAITANVVRDLERAIDRLYPERLGQHAPSAEPPPVPPGAWAIASNASGYVQAIDAERILEVAARHEVVVWLQIRPGDFVIEGMTIAAASPAPLEGPALARALNQACILGSERSSHQDAGFVIQQLVEIALRGLSPGVNEPFTAVTCIDRLGQGLCRLAGRRMPGPARADNAGTLRVVAPGWTFEELLDGAFRPIVTYADRNAMVRLRMLEVLTRIASVASRPEDRAAIGRAADLVHASAADVEDTRQRAELSRAFDALHRRLSEPTAHQLRQ